MVSASKDGKARRGGAVSQVLPGSRISGSLPTKGFKIYCEEVKIKKGNAGVEGTGAVSRSLVKPPFATRKSVPSLPAKASTISEMRANKSNPENIKKGVGSKGNSGIANMNTVRKALADVSNLKNVRSYRLKCQESCSTGLKKCPPGKQNILKSKVQTTKNQEPRKSLTKSIASVDTSSTKGAFYQVKTSRGNGYANSRSRLMSLPGNVKSSSGNAISSSSSQEATSSEKSQNNVVHKPRRAGRESCVETSAPQTRKKGESCVETSAPPTRKNGESCVETSAPQTRKKGICRRSYTLSLMTGHEVIGRCSSKIYNLPDIDNQADPLEVAEYIDDIYEYYWNMEDQNPLAENYLRHQKHITPRMRGVLIDWLIEVHLKFCLMQETLFLMVELLDRALSVIPIEKDEVQLVGLTSLLLASKYEDFWHPKVVDLLSISVFSYTKEQLLTMEMLILQRLKFRMNLPTPYVFILRFLKASQSEKVLEHLAFYLIELCLVEYQALTFKPSLLCASAVYLARCTLQVSPVWSELLRKHTHYKEKELRPCANMILGFQKSASASSWKSTYEKFLDPELGCAAKIKPIAKLPP